MKPIKGPITLVLNNVSNATFIGNSLQTKCYAPSGSPYITLGAGADNVFSPGEVLFFPLSFLQTGAGNITYTACDQWFAHEVRKTENHQR
jgi:hypothetical protein